MGIKSHEDLINAAISEYKNSNNSLVNVGKKFGYTGGWLLKHMANRGLKRRGNSEWKLNELSKKMAAEDYLKGVQLKVIAKKYNVSRRTITEWVKGAGIKPLVFSERLGVTSEMKLKARDLYINQKLNCCEIAKILNVSNRSVLEWVKDVKRTKSEISCILSFKGKKRNYGKKGYSNTRFGIIRFDSSFEESRIMQLSKNINVLSLDRCHYLIKYDNKNYNPDFIVEYNCGCKCIEEVKPAYMLNNEINLKKFKAATIFAKNNGLIFSIVTEKDIYGK